MVWLPGAYHGAQDFLAAGFAEAVRTRRTALDLIFVDLELAHVGDRSALQRLRSDLVLPARAAGVSIWLGGISLGGLFALGYAAAFPDEVDGLCLLAPYLGNRILTAEIAQAAGLAAWQPGELAETVRNRTQEKIDDFRARAGAYPYSAREIYIEVRPGAGGVDFDPMLTRTFFDDVIARLTDLGSVDRIIFYNSHGTQVSVHP